MLRVTAKAWNSRDYNVHDESGLVGKILVGSRFVGHVLTVGDERYGARMRGWIGRRYFMESSDVVVARARARLDWAGLVEAIGLGLGLFHSTLVLEYSSAKYTLRFRGFWSMTVDLVQENTVVGSVVHTSGFPWSSATADLPSELPVQIRLFVIWLTLLPLKFE